MGASRSKLQSHQEFFKYFEKKYKLFNENNQDYFGNVQLYQYDQTKEDLEKEDDEFILVRRQLLRTKEQYNSFKEQILLRESQMQHPNLLSLLSFCETNDMNLCGNFNKITLYFQYFENTLEREILARAMVEPKQYYAEPELWYILNSLISVCSLLELENQFTSKTPFIRPNSVFVTKMGHLKLADFALAKLNSTDISSNYQQLFPPEIIKNISMGINWSKVQVFMLGILILQAASLEEIQDFFYETKGQKGIMMEQLYELSELQILYFQDYFRGLTTKYSKFLKNIINDMLQINEITRPSFHSLNIILLPFQEQINSLEFYGNEQNNQIQDQNETKQLNDELQCLDEEQAEFINEDQIIQNANQEISQDDWQFQQEISENNYCLEKSKLEIQKDSAIFFKIRTPNDQNTEISKDYEYLQSKEVPLTLTEISNLQVKQQAQSQKPQQKFLKESAGPKPVLSQKQKPKKKQFHINLEEIDKQIQKAIKQSQESIHKYAELIQDKENQQKIKQKKTNQFMTENIPKIIKNPQKYKPATANNTKSVKH